MPRGPRLDTPGALQHVMVRGIEACRIFLSDRDREDLLKRFAEVMPASETAVYAWSLLTNHFHLLIRPKQHSISQLMQSVLVSHTQRYHKHRQSLGHVWQGRFRSPVIEEDDHLLTVLRYIEANPVRAEMVEHAGDYRWSSFTAHGQGAGNELLSVCPPYQQLSPYAAVRQRRWEAYVHQTPDADELSAIRRSVERSLPFGSHAWVKKLSTKLNLDLTIRPRGRPKTTTTESGK